MFLLLVFFFHVISVITKHLIKYISSISTKYIVVKVILGNNIILSYNDR